MILLAAALQLSAYGQGDPGYDGNPGSREKLGSFDSVAIHIRAETELIRGSKNSVDIQMSERAARNIDVYNDRGTLVIKARNGYWVRKDDSVKIRITMPRWESVKMTASGKLYSSDRWDLDYALIRNSGSCEIRLDSLDTDRLNFRGSGSGDIRFGELIVQDDIEMTSTGSGDIDADYLECENLSLHLTGSGDFSAQLDTEIFTARTTGSGMIIASGSCFRADFNTTGSGGVSAEDLDAEEAYIRITGSGDTTLKDGAHLKEIRMTGSGTFRSL